MNCLKIIENQGKELFTSHEKEKESQINVTETFEFMPAEFHDLKKEIKKKDEKINQLKKTIKNLVEKHKIFSCDVDNLDQYSRQNYLFLHGFNKNNDKSTYEILIKRFLKSYVLKSTNLDLNLDNKPRPIIVKIARYAIIFLKKRKLKGERFLITESLTSSRMHLLGEALNEYGI